jgi:acetate kinase
MLNKKSGVLAISEKSSDFRDLEAGRDEGDEKCILALEKFFYEVAKYIGAYAAALNGIDVLTFTAGVGENGPETRQAICDYLGFMGVKIDAEANKVRGKEALISTPDSAVQVWVVPTNEELMIAQDTAALVKNA